MLLRSARIATLAGAMALAVPGVANATQGAFFGFHGPVIDNQPMSQGTAPTYADSESIPKYKAVAADTVRLHIPWHNVEPRKGTFDWRWGPSPVELDLEAVAGVKFIAIVSGAPLWANLRNLGCLYGRCAGNIPPAAGNMADYANFIREVALRYAGRIRAIEIWNEPNVGRYFSPDSAPGEGAQNRERTQGYPNWSREYAQVVCAGYDGMRQAAAQNPAAFVPVIHGGLSGGPDQLWADSDGARFLRAVYARMAEMGRPECFDVVGVHPYQDTDPVPSSPPQNETGLSNFQLVMKSFRDSIAATDQANPARALWITEVGYTTSITKHTPWQQCEYLNKIADWVRDAPDTEALIIHRLQDLEDVTNTWTQGHFGVLHHGGEPKPAYKALLQQRAGVPWTCPLI